jgi:hypothetical protein
MVLNKNLIYNFIFLYCNLYMFDINIATSLVKLEQLKLNYYTNWDLLVIE